MQLVFESAVLLMISCSVIGQLEILGLYSCCLTNTDCSSDRSCSEFKCIDPCLGHACDDKHECKVTNHIPACARKAAPAVPSPRSLTKKYRLVMEQLNWNEAVAHCASKNMNLASIESEEEQGSVVNLIKTSGCGNSPQCQEWWLGGSDLNNERKYIWRSNGRPLTYRHFRIGEPNHRTIGTETEHCLELVIGHVMGGYWDYEWNDKQCSLRHYSVCEYFE